jgi:recombination protein RecA
MRRIQAIKVGGEVVGGRTRVRVTKNKVAPPFREAEFDILFNEGISKEGDIIDLGVSVGVVEKRGAFYLYGGQRIGQGRENARQFLKDHPDLRDAIEQHIRQEVALGAAQGLVAITPATSEDELMEEEAL